MLGASKMEAAVDEAKKALWTKVIADFELSGQTQREFSEARQIDLSRLRYWLYTFRNETRLARLRRRRKIRRTSPATRRPQVWARVCCRCAW